MDKLGDPFAPLTEAELVDAARQVSSDLDADAPKPICPPSDAEDVAVATARLFGRKPEMSWRYETAKGEAAFYVVRWNESGKKVIRPLSWFDGGGWKFGAWPNNRPLYNLAAISEQPKAPILLCEGEKTADEAARIFVDRVVTTSSGGAEAAEKSDWSPLAGRDVLIWPDCDAAGDGYARDVAAKLAALGCSISIIDAKALASINPNGGAREPQEKWDAANAIAEWKDVAALRRAALECEKPYDPGPRYQSHGAFTMTSDGLEVETARGNGSARKPVVRERVSGPFEILGQSRNPSGGDWGLWLRWRDGDGRIHQMCVASAALHAEPAALCQSLASKGLHIERSKQRSLADYLNGADVTGRVTRVETTGWHCIRGREVFVLPLETIGPAAAETVFLEGGAGAPYEARGSLADWRAGVGSLSAGHALPMLAISAALAGPLIHLAGGEGGGVHFFGRSSTGKTTILQAAASVWGRGASPGYVRAWRATVNGLEGAAALATDTALILDEMGVLDARDAAAAIYSLANGGGKQRAGRDGALREPRSWRAMTVSSGEIPFEAKLTEGRGKARAGQMLRLLDIPADRGFGFGVFDHGGEAGDAGALARAIKAGAITSYGTAGPEFVRRLIREDVNGDDVRAVIANFTKAECPHGADGQIERVAQRLGLIAAAGELAISLSAAPWSPGDPLKAAAWAFKAWLANRGGSEPAEVGQAIAQVRLFIEQHGDSRFDPLDGPEAKPSPNRAGWRKGEGEAQEWFIPPETWKSEICAGLDVGYVARTLAERGMIVRASDGFQPVRRIGGANKRVYVVTARIFAGCDNVA